MSTELPNCREDAEQLDQNDPLAGLREAFKLPEGIIYLVGHSLGPASHCAIEQVRKTAELEWADGMVGSWNSADWINLPQTVGAQLAPLIGAGPHEVIVCDSVSVNLFKLSAAALPLARAKKIIIEDDEFPTDQYIAKGLTDLSGVAYDRVPSGQGLKALKNGGVLIKSAVNYRTAEIADIAAAEKIAQQNGGVIVWDLSHATGVINLDLAADSARLATGCTYKYLNGGPGAPAFIYAREDIVGQLISPLPGWLGHKHPFAFEKDYEPADHAARFVAGTPGILSLSALSGALQVFDGISVSDLAAKAQGLSDMCLNRAIHMDLKTTCPTEARYRGGHVSLLHDNGYAIVQALAARGIKSDFRTPDTIRFGFSPLFLRYVDVWDTMDALSDILSNRLWNQDKFKVRQKVT